MAILITGAGLIGAHAAKALQVRGAHILLYDATPCREYLQTVLDLSDVEVVAGEITNLPELTTLMQQNQVTGVVHTAGLIGSAVARQPHRGVEVNLGGSIAVMEAARLARVRRFVFCSSMAVYDFDRLPSAAAIREDSPLGPKNLYAATKASAELLLSQYGALCDMEVIALRLAGVFGRGRYVGGSWMGRILNRILEATLDGREISIEAKWIGTNEFIYVKDVAEAIALTCLEPKRLDGAMNIGTGKLHTVVELIREIEALVKGSRIEIIHSAENETVSYLMRDQPFDVSRACEELDFRSRYSLRSGLQDYIDELGRFAGHYQTLD